MSKTEGSAPSYPATHTVDGKQITFQPMGERDGQALLAFARTLEPHDLLFLQRDITSETAIAEWIDEIRAGVVTTILATHEDGSVAGWATVHRSHLPWSAHVAELRVLIAKDLRGKGLGRLLVADAFAIALSEGIEKMMARMTLDQRGAIAVFESFGFRPEALQIG